MSKDKDIWDKISALTPLVLGVMVTGIGSAFTHVYNANQLKLNQIIALDKLRPQLTSNAPEERAFAYSSFVALGYEDMAVKVIQVNGDQSGRATLNKLVETGASPKIQARAKEAIEELNDAISFDSNVIESAKPSLILYTAEWCGPCQPVEAVLDELVNEYEVKININSVDVDMNHEIASRYDIRGMPSLVIFENGKDVGIQVGAQSKEKIQAFIENKINVE